MISRSTNIRAALRSRQRGFLLNPYRFGAGGEADPFFANVSLLLHCNGVDGSTDFLDGSLSHKTVTANGDAKVSTERSMFGGASALFSGGGFLGIAAHSSLYPALGSDFTVEAWVYIPATSLGVTRTIAGMTSTVSGYNTWALDIQADRSLLFQVYDGSVRYGMTSENSVPGDSWIHVAGAKSGTSLSAFLNGSKGATVGTLVGSPVGPNGRLAVGRVGEYSGGQYLIGNVDEFRITQGIARYTANFTPPAAAFPDS